ncbi:hypothetical protein AVEN_25524-1 [Araneus ventricosus]|uniref:Uncharacterized protein n=1 Tax=Araneus ventricosus TaxID=182803 RepID=A0A4Y2GF97_ARAVE|nr:hypothetical protein AVEN_25524-1 [Araneus ventricosus]
MALRVALGVPKWTPNIVLLKIAGQKVLSEKIKRLEEQFFIRQVANGTHSPIYQQNCNPRTKLIKKDEVMITNLFADLETSTGHIIFLIPSSLGTIFVKFIFQILASK